MSKWPDTLIVRKCGLVIAEQAMLRAAELIHRSGKDYAFAPNQLVEFDGWLRSDGHRRNPGTTADLIAATLFAAIRDGLIVVPLREEIAQHASVIHKAGLFTLSSHIDTNSICRNEMVD